MQIDALQSSLGTIVYFGDGIVDAGVRDHAHAEQAVRVVGAVFFSKPFVVGADHRLVGVVVSDAAPKLGVTAVRVENLRIDTVLILLPQPLLRRAGTGSFEPILLQAVLFIGQSGDGGRPRTARRPVLDENPFVAVGENHRARRPFAPAFRHPRRPPFRANVQMRISGNTPVMTRHWHPPG